MAWQLRIVPSRGGGDSLGSVEQVQAKLRGADPEIELFRDASGAEKLASMESQGLTVPDVIREHWLGSKGAFQGLIQGEGFTIEFHLGEDETTVAAVGIDVRGSGDPMPVIERLMMVEGWKVLDLQGQPPTIEFWRSFGDWRDDGIGQVGDERA
jgi:hypothetical protein